MSKSEEFQFKNLDATLCTHLVYDDFKIDENGIFVASQPELLNQAIDGTHILSKLATLKLNIPGLKILASVGGLDSYETLSTMMSDSGKRKIFIESTVNFLSGNGFDGLDFQWMMGKNNNDKENHAILAKQLNEELTKINKILVYCVKTLPLYENLFELYNIREISKYANYVILKTFEMREDFTRVGFDAALYPSTNDNDINIKSLVEFWLNEGLPAEKLLIHISTIGRNYTLADSNSYKPGALTDITKKPESSVYYNKFCSLLKKDSKWIERWDNTQKAVYAYKSNIWINYDNIESVKSKTEFVFNLKLGGISFGPLQYDDYEGKCKIGQYPLLNTIYSNLKTETEQYKYRVNFQILKRHIRSGKAEQIYYKEDEFNLENDLFS